MTDTLRDRIAAAIHQDNAFGWTEYQCGVAADAVMREITSTHLMLPCRNCGCPLVRDWSAKDHDKDRRLFKDGVWGCGDSRCKACY